MNRQRYSLTELAYRDGLGGVSSILVPHGDLTPEEAQERQDAEEHRGSIYQEERHERRQVSHEPRNVLLMRVARRSH